MSSSTTVSNVGAPFDQDLSFNSHIQQVPRTALFHLRNIRKIRHFKKHISPVLVSLHWLPIKSRIEFKILLLTYKALNGIGPSCLKELVAPYYLRSLKVVWEVEPLVIRLLFFGIIYRLRSGGQTLSLPLRVDFKLSF